MNGPLYSLWKPVDVLRLERYADFALLNGDEEIPQRPFWHRGNDVVPVRFLIQPIAEVRYQTTRKGADGRGFAHAVGAENAHDTLFGGCWKTEQTKSIHGVPVDHVGFKLTREVLNDEGVMRTLVDTDTAPDAEAFRDVGLARLLIHDDAFLSVANRGAKIMTLVVAFLWLTIVFLQNGNTHQITRPFLSSMLFCFTC